MPVFRTCLIICLFFVGAVSAYTQKSESHGFPKWERYVAGEGKISVLMPGLPIAVRRSYVCSELRSNLYAIYSGGALYKLEIVSEGPVPYSSCKKIVKFDDETFEARLVELKNARNTTSVTQFEQKGFVGWQVSAPNVKKWLFRDEKKGRWIELSIFRESTASLDEERFIRSLDLSGKEKGKKIGDGAASVVGEKLAYEPEVLDDPKNEDETDKNETDKDEIEGLVIFSKPRTRYTDAARQNGTQGKVILRVAFLANGTVGKIDIVSGLRDGLSEQAIYAARKILFLPARKNGRLVTVSKSIQYNYTIY